MKKKFSLLVFLFFTSVFCFSAVPKWIVNLEKEFPSKKYIRAVGEGNSETSAKQAAVAELSSYFSETIESQTYAHSYKSQNDSMYTSNSSINQNITVSTDSELFAVHYTQSWYDKKEKKYSVCAYINREEAFNIISQKLSLYEQSFIRKIKLEKTENEDFRKIIILNNALSEEQTMNTLYEYSMLLDFDKSKKFEDCMLLIEKEKNTLFKLKKENPVSVVSRGDFSNQIQSIISKILTENGFIISKNADYKITSESIFRGLETNGIISCTPMVTVFLEGKSGTISSCVPSLENKSSYTKQTVIKMALAEIENVLNEKLFQDLLK